MFHRSSIILRSRKLELLRPIARQNSTSIFKKNFFPPKKYQRREIEDLIIEEPKRFKNQSLQQYYDDIVIYLINDEISPNLKYQIVFEKLNLLLQQPKNEESIKALQIIMNHLSDFHRRKKLENIPLRLNIQLFEYTSDYQDTNFPKFLLEDLFSNINNLPNTTVILLIELLQTQNIQYEKILNNLQFKLKDESFVSEYLNYLQSRDRLRLSTFEQLSKFILNDEIIMKLNQYIEKLFEENLPEIHCYNNLELNIDRIQLLLNEISSQVDLVSVKLETLLILLNKQWEFINVNACADSIIQLQRIMSYINTQPDEVYQAIFKQNLDDESLAETMLYVSWKYNFQNLSKKLNTCILNDKIKFSDNLRFQVSVYQSEENLQSITNVLPDLSSETFEKYLQAALIKQSTIIDQVIDHFQNNNPSFEQTPYSFKYQIDYFIEHDNHEKALAIYNQSINNHIPWSQCIKDPTVYRTLNDLIQILVKHLPTKESFVMFQRIKTQLQTEINIDSLNALIPTILKHNLVGDVVELLKRELPQIPSGSSMKLPIDKPYGYKYKKLFDSLFNYVITNTHDQSVYANWTLLKTLYSYFIFPQESILPALKLFCTHKRWNAALIIFQKQIELHHMHGCNPPDENIYKYLIGEFGDNLYEEGLIEVHENLKMDTSIINQDLDLQHLLMKSYCNLQDVSKVRDLFLILNSQGRINNETAVIMLKAYIYNDLNYVEKFWNNLSMFGVIPDANLVKQYLIAYSYHGQFDKCIELIENVNDYDVEVNDAMILDIYNFCYKDDIQVKFKDYFQLNYPDLWYKCVESGRLTISDGYLPDGDSLGEKENSLTT